MVRSVTVSLLLATVFVGRAVAQTQQERAIPPTTYELMINGESFLVELNRMTRLRSKENPGTDYKVALRVATTQRLKLDSVQFAYDWMAKVVDDRKKQRRTVRLTHELGFGMLITDLGAALPVEAQDEALKILAESVVKSYREMGVKDLEAGEPVDRKFDGTSGRGLVIYYRDAQGLNRSCLIYVLAGPNFTVSCIVQYLDRDFENVKPLLLQTLNSFRSVEGPDAAVQSPRIDEEGRGRSEER